MYLKTNENLPVLGNVCENNLFYRLVREDDGTRTHDLQSHNLTL